MDSHPRELPAAETWPIRRAEELISSLTGVVSVRIVTRSGGEIEEIHVLTTEEVSAKQTVRNIESALLAQLGVAVDHRKISVAQTRDGRNALTEVRLEPFARKRRPERRVVFVGHEVEREKNHRVRTRVTLRWDEEEVVGEATGTDLGRVRLETAANATLRGLESVFARARGEEANPVVFALDGVKVLDAFDRTFVLVAVHAVSGRQIVALAGAADLGDSPDRSVVLATLQATDRWVRGQF
ncbi:MAG: hypothetical protein HY704_15700 [Gemmatimonadetes bacterium]|nr:hypothetical protein [Gemmatimonadota bacterium]